MKKLIVFIFFLFSFNANADLILSEGFSDPNVLKYNAKISSKEEDLIARKLFAFSETSSSKEIFYSEGQIRGQSSIYCVSEYVFTEDNLENLKVILIMTGQDTDFITESNDYTVRVHYVLGEFFSYKINRNV